MVKKRKMITSEDDCQQIEMKKFKSEPVAMNCLSNLPTELKVLILKKLAFRDLSVMTTVCKPFRDIIFTHFLLSKDYLVATFKAISKSGTTDDYFQMASDLGLLIKRSTFILPNYKRVKLIISIFQIVDLKSKLKIIYTTDKTAFKSLTRAIKSVLAKIIVGWKFKEVLKLIDEIELYFNHTKLLLLAMTKEFGIVRQDEQYLRYFYRKVIFECFEDNSARAKWLNYFLNYHTNFTSDENQRITFQAKLLLLLFAPIFQDENSELVYIDWFGFTTTLFVKEGLEYLGFALRLLNSLKPKSRPNVCALYRTITNIGLFWLYENASTLLYHCGINIAKQMIDYLLKRENFVQLVRYLTSLFIVESKLIELSKIQPTEKMMEAVYDCLKSSLHMSSFESLMDLITSEFFSMSRAIERLAEDREYLETSEIVGGILEFYELRLRKRNLSISNDFVTKPKV